MMKALLLLTILFFSLHSFSQHLHSKKINQQLDAFRKNYVAAYNKPDADALATLYDEHATYIGTGGDVTQGRDKIRIGLKNSSSYLEDFALTPVETGGNKKWVYQYGTYSQKMTASNQNETLTGKYLIVLKRVSKNTWRIQKQMVSRNRD